MSKQATNSWCRVETLVFILAIIAGPVSTKLDYIAWLSFFTLILVHMILDRDYLEEWCKWLWK